jgi:mannitol-1-phosphate/altronate dehydrogenase
MLLDEIVPLVAEGDITMEEARSFAMQVIDRFSNQSIEHLWVNIAVQYTAKMQMRVVPLVDKYVKQHGKAPMLISFGFAAYLLFMKSKNDPGAIDALASKTTIVASEVFDKQVFDCIDKMDASSIKNVLVSLLNK